MSILSAEHACAYLVTSSRCMGSACACSAAAVSCCACDTSLRRLSTNLCSAACCHMYKRCVHMRRAGLGARYKYSAVLRAARVTSGGADTAASEYVHLYDVCLAERLPVLRS